jgi:FKBP-type peptidyl-prolyl cis-trans isomerase FklB
MIPVRIFVFLIAVLASTVSAGTTPEGIQFLEAKKLEEGVVETASGLLYKEIRPGSGKTPTENSPCSCHYAGRLIDGTEFDSSYKRGAPLSFAPNQGNGNFFGATWPTFVMLTHFSLHDRF